MTHIKALKLARDCIRDSVEYKQGKATAIEAVEDIDEALAQSQQEPPFSVQQAYAMAQVCLDLHEALGCKWGDNPYLALAGLREEQPPVAKPHEQEPVAWLRDPKHYPIPDLILPHVTWKQERLNTIPLYTSPPQRTWVGLTDEEIEKNWKRQVGTVRPNYSFTRAIEAKLKEKNT